MTSLSGGVHAFMGTQVDVAAMRQPPPGTSRQRGALHDATGQLPQPRENFLRLEHDISLCGVRWTGAGWQGGA